MARQRAAGGAKWTAGRRRRTGAALAGASESTALAATIGRQLREARRARQLTQAAAGERVGISHARWGQLERGHGSGAPLGLWIAAGIAVGRPMAISLTRSTTPLPREAGHLGAQEALLRWAAGAGNAGTFELQTRPAPNATYIDIGIRDDRRRLLEVIEVWNTIDDLGAATRLFKRKLAEAGEIAAAIGGEAGPFDVRGSWVLRDTAENRELVRRYPSVLRAQFPGSSPGWARALRHGAEPPGTPGIAWIDLAATRLFALRLPARQVGPGSSR
jgi:transcriptional regulator with XRE-family HTH domain